MEESERRTKPFGTSQVAFISAPFFFAFKKQREYFEQTSRNFK
jgi:hypothetical protein